MLDRAEKLRKDKRLSQIAKASQELLTRVDCANVTAEVIDNLKVNFYFFQMSFKEKSNVSIHRHVPVFTFASPI